MSCDNQSGVQAEPELFPDFHDPSGALQGPWRFLVQLDTGVTLTSATVKAVDENAYPLPFDATGVDGDSLVVTFDRIELTTDQFKPNVWGIYFYTQNGSPKTYRIQARYTKSDGTGRDLTMLLVCRQG